VLWTLQNVAKHTKRTRIIRIEGPPQHPVDRTVAWCRSDSLNDSRPRHRCMVSMTEGRCSRARPSGRSAVRDLLCQPCVELLMS
jgi:hypothetical protein